MEQDTPVRIQDDLYHFVNGAWLEKAVIPDDKPCSGGFADLDTGVEEVMMRDFREMASGKRKIPNAYLEKAIRLYKKAIDVKRRNERASPPCCRI